MLNPVRGHCKGHPPRCSSVVLCWPIAGRDAISQRFRRQDRADTSAPAAGGSGGRRARAAEAKHEDESWAGLEKDNKMAEHFWRRNQPLVGLRYLQTSMHAQQTAMTAALVDMQSKPTGRGESSRCPVGRRSDRAA